MIQYLPNFLTLIRILATPIFIYLLFWRGLEGYPWALGLFIAASITDIVDGYLARLLQVESSFGKMLDPAADKILVLSALISFVTLDLIYTWMVVVIILRDVFITVIRYILEKRNMPMTTSALAKGKTAVQLSSVIIILGYLSLKSYEVDYITNFIENSHLILILMYLTVIFTIYTGLNYYLTYRKAIHAISRNASN